MDKIIFCDIIAPNFFDKNQCFETSFLCPFSGHVKLVSKRQDVIFEIVFSPVALKIISKELTERKHAS